MSVSSSPQSPLFVLPPPPAVQTRSPVWPLWAVFISSVFSGLVILAGSVWTSVPQIPALAAASVALFGAFGAVCAWLLNKIPYYWPVARNTTLLALLWGAGAAAGYALLANTAIYRYFADRGDTAAWSMFSPFTEEPMKALGIVVVLLLAATRPRTALDGLVAGSFVGLGFETVENVVQSINNALASPPDQWGSLTTDVIHEVLRRSWTGHIVITGIAGFGIAYAMTAQHRSTVRRWAVGVALVLLALAAHLLWNSHRFGVFYVLGQFGTLAFFIWLIRVGRAQEARLYSPYLSCAAPALMQTPPGGSSRKQRRARARLAGAIGNGDVGRAHAAADALAMATAR
jgi:RsiW-degrading membrane proteinase PrsW (M82 family)